MENFKEESEATAERIHYHCKVCATDVFAYDKIRCSYCSAPICEKCDTTGFCLNCFLNLKKDAQSSLKLSRTLAWVVPLILAFVIRSSWGLWFTGVLGSIAFFIFIHFYFRYKVMKTPAIYFLPRWRNIVESNEYKEFIENDDNLRVLSFFKVTEDESLAQEMVRSLKAQELENIKFEKPENESEDEDHDGPDLPAYFDEKYKLTPEMRSILYTDLDDDIDEMLELDYDEIAQKETEESEKQEVKQKEKEEKSGPVSGKIENCTICNKPLTKGNICFECKVRICPECGEDNRFSSNRCVCGYNFIPLEDLLGD